MVNDKKVSARDISKMIENGEIETANKLLGRPFRINGLVTEGKHNGKKIDFPTANLKLEYRYVYPKSGVYIGYGYVYGKKYKAIINVGTHPTINPLKEPVIEVHLIDFEGVIYGKTIFCDFIKYIRDEKKFDSLDELKAQLTKDRQKAKKLLQ